MDVKQTDVYNDWFRRLRDVEARAKTDAKAIGMTEISRRAGLGPIRCTKR
ncbi:MAG: hypothetical protein LBO20_00855 [Bifidobacteriaceae bacterium]|nr:hypothetical protein [Bifidobacteriaceae bacterium]